MLRGCFHDPKETALENCANSRVMDKYYYINKDLSKNSTIIQKINKKLDKSIAVSNLKSSITNEAKSKKTMLEFATKYPILYPVIPYDLEKLKTEIILFLIESIEPGLKRSFLS